MSRSSRNAAVIAIVGAALVCAYLIAWARVDRLHIGLSDFTASYVGATLLEHGHRAGLYDDSVQRPVHDRLIAPAVEPNLPFVVPPTGVAPVLPLAGLDLATAYRVFGLLQLALVAAAAAVAGLPLLRQNQSLAGAAALVALAGLATLPLLLLGQLDGLLALGLAIGHRLLARHRDVAGGLALGLTAAMSKPHLFLGVAAFLLAWRQRRVLAGAISGAVLLILIDLAVVGAGGLQGLVAADSRDASLWPLASLLGWNGFFGSWLGDGTAAQVLGISGDIAALGICAAAGEMVRRRRYHFSHGLAVTMTLSLLASPHLLAHDLVLLAPVVVWCLAGAAQPDLRRWPRNRDLGVLAGWVGFNLVLALDLGNQKPAPPGRLVPLALLALGLAGWRGLSRPAGDRAPE